VLPGEGLSWLHAEGTPQGGRKHAAKERIGLHGFLLSCLPRAVVGALEQSASRGSFGRPAASLLRRIVDSRLRRARFTGTGDTNRIAPDLGLDDGCRSADRFWLSCCKISMVKQASIHTLGGAPNDQSRTVSTKRFAAWLRVALGLSFGLGVASCSSSVSPITGAGGGSNNGVGGSATGVGGDDGQPSLAGRGGKSGGSAGASSGGDSGSAGTAGGGIGELTRPVAMNDVSILFPLGTASDYSTGHLRADSTGKRGVLFPASVFEKISIEGSAAGSGVGGPSTAPYANMRVVALRLDPCFAELRPTPSATTCRNQLRLVFQELQASTTGVSAFDSGVHALYTITRAELLAILNEIVRLREADGGQGGKGPLAPHALMVAQGLAGSFSTAIQKLILQYAGEQNLVRVTAMTSENAGFQWSFFGFDISGASPKAVPLAIATLAATASADGTEQSFFRGFQSSTDPIGSFVPKPTGPDDFTVLADVKSALMLSAADQAKLSRALARVENPSIFTPDTLDCARCHTASPLGQNVARDRLHLSEADDDDAFHPDGKWVTAEEMSATDFSGASQTNPDVPLVNVHAFSYAIERPSVNQRTVNETAAVVQFLNDSFYVVR